jgi:hypothetical protein
MDQPHSESSIKFALRPFARAARRALFDFRNWKLNHYAAPSPKAVKDRVLQRNGLPGSTWVETGTFLGETTILLAQWGKAVYSLEPATSLYDRAVTRFASHKHVKIVNAPSEIEFPRLLPTLKGPVNFWLDGHYSAGATYQGEKDTPVMAELDSIAQYLAHLKPIVILIDDVRCFDPSLPEYAGYPPLDKLVDWARSHNLAWHIEHDILVIRSQ